MVYSINVTLVLQTLQWFPTAPEIKSKCFVLRLRGVSHWGPSTSLASQLPVLPFFPVFILFLDASGLLCLRPFALVLLLPGVVSLMPSRDMVVFRHLAQFISSETFPNKT